MRARCENQINKHIINGPNRVPTTWQAYELVAIIRILFIMAGAYCFSIKRQVSPFTPISPCLECPSASFLKPHPFPEDTVVVSPGVWIFTRQQWVSRGVNPTPLHQGNQIPRPPGHSFSSGVLLTFPTSTASLAILPTWRGASQGSTESAELNDDTELEFSQHYLCLLHPFNGH